MDVIQRAELNVVPKPPLRQASNERDGVKLEKTKNNTLPILEGGTALKKPTRNINEESKLEEASKVIEEVEKIYKKMEIELTQNFIKLNISHYNLDNNMFTFIMKGT